MYLSNLVVGSLWGTTPETLQMLADNAFLDSEALKVAGTKKHTSSTSPEELTLSDSVAIIPVRGPLSKRHTIYSLLNGGSSLTGIESKFAQALADHRVKGILLDIDSPGGPVDGVSSVSDAIRQGRQKKPVVAFANGEMLGTAYWIGSAASRVVTERTAYVGSIGIAMVHSDWSVNDAKHGVKRTIITAGKLKSLGNSLAPLSDTDRRELQNRLDYVYRIFVDAIAQNREVSEQTVSSEMADGRVFIGSGAVESGLADTVGDFKSALALAKDQTGIRLAASSGPATRKQVQQEQRSMKMKGFMELVDEHIAQQTRIGKEVGRAEAMQVIMKKHPEAHRRYIEDANRGKRIDWR